MKSSIFAIFFLFIASSLNAQISIGIRGAAKASTVSKFDLIQNVTPEFRYKLAPNIAVFAEIPITSNFSFQPELAYAQKGFLVKEGITAAGQFAGVAIPINGQVNFKTHYMDVPLLAKFHFGDKSAAHYYLMVGPSIGYLADAGLRVKVLNIFPINTGFSKEVFKPVELSGIAALGFELPVAKKAKVFVEGRYQLGLGRILDTPIVELPVRNRSFSGGMGLKLEI